MKDLQQARREIDGKPAVSESYQKPRRSRGNRGRGRGRQGGPPAPRKPVASPWASELAQQWVDLGEAAGFDFPYDVNFFAKALQRKVEKDPIMSKLQEKGERDKVQRWVAKMIERWWAEYDTNGVHSGNAKDFFLVIDWEDVKEYARTCLRAAYLLKHGRKIPPPLYENQQEYQARLKKIHDDHQIDRWANAEEPEYEQPQVDEAGRERLRSFADRRRKK